MIVKLLTSRRFVSSSSVNSPVAQTAGTTAAALGWAGPHSLQGNQDVSRAARPSTAQHSPLHQPPARALTGTLAAQALVEPMDMMGNNEAYQRYF